jgi:hypothetical protein
LGSALKLSVPTIVPETVWVEPARALKLSVPPVLKKAVPAALPLPAPPPPPCPTERVPARDCESLKVIEAPLSPRTNTFPPKAAPPPPPAPLVFCPAAPPPKPARPL